MKKLMLFIFVIFSISVLSLSSVFVIAEMQELIIPVYNGWNLIPFNVLTGALNDNSDVGLSDFKYMFLYDVNKKEYALVWKNGDWTSEAKTTYFNFNRGEENWITSSSLWVYSEKTGSINMWSEGGGDISKFKLKSGWNFIFTLPSMYDKKLGDIKGDCIIERVYMWNPEDKEWETDFGMSQGISRDAIALGFIIKVENDCNLGIASNGINPPSLPQNSNECSDTDNGKDYFVRGYVNGKYNDPLTSNIRDERMMDTCLNSPDTSDSDFDYYKQIGLVNDNDINNLKILLEAYCDDGLIKLEKYQCTNNCENGACVQ
ncbi:MAG: hypothetical protein PHF67_01945 [Candidatus Nanoarchaeia archaeon]|nr:hypothetical protein [Candidatus Nanoarchaeia archaeon]